jgi:AraC-like DNA-binding protein
MGITPLEYMTKLRMKKAEQLLSAMRNKEYSVAEVAQMCGYEDALYFSRVFKKTYGCSPSNFNKKTDTP